MGHLAPEGIYLELFNHLFFFVQTQKTGAREHKWEQDGKANFLYKLALTVAR